MAAAWKSDGLQCDRFRSRSLGRPSCPKYGTHMHTYCPAAPFLPSFFLSDPASSAVRIFSLNGVSRSARPPGSSVVREKNSVRPSLRPSVSRPRPSVRPTYAEVLTRRTEGEGGREGRVKSEICAYLLSLVPFPNQCRTCERNEGDTSDSKTKTFSCDLDKW